MQPPGNTIKKKNNNDEKENMSTDKASKWETITHLELVDLRRIYLATNLIIYLYLLGEQQAEATISIQYSDQLDRSVC